MKRIKLQRKRSHPLPQTMFYSGNYVGEARRISVQSFLPYKGVPAALSWRKSTAVRFGSPPQHAVLMYETIL